MPAPDPGDPKPKLDPAVTRTQADGDAMDGQIILNRPDLIDESPQQPPALGPAPIDGLQEPPTDLDPLPGVVPIGPAAPPAADDGRKIFLPIPPETRRTFSVNGGPNFKFDVKETPEGEIIYILQGGVNLIANIPRKPDPVPKGEIPPPVGTPPPFATVDVTADSIIIWTRREEKQAGAPGDPTVGVSQKPDTPMQLYMEGNVRIRRDDRKLAGNGDEKIFEAAQAYYDLRTERLVALDGRVYTNTPGLLAPLRTDGKRIDQYKEVRGIDPKKGGYILGPQQIRVDQSVTSGSRFPIPGYRFRSRSLDITDITETLTDQNTGGKVGPGGDPVEQDRVQLFEAYDNFLFLGKLPVFYSPYSKFTSEFDPLLRNFRFQTGNVFGQTAQFDLSGYRLFNIRRPKWTDIWNIDIDYLSYRGFAVGSELGWFGRDFIGDLQNPYGNAKTKVNHPYFGYFDLWGINDTGRDVLGPGPAIITYGPNGAGKQGYQRTSQPTFLDYRGRATARHMVRLLDPEEVTDVDLRLQFEAGYVSDRNFIEEYYKRLFDTGVDQETLFYGIYQNQNRALTLQTEANLQNWYTETQWLPKLEYTRLGDNFLNNYVSISSRTGVDYASTHTAVEVNNPNIFAFLPTDPVSNTSGTLNTGRAYAATEIDVPLKFEYLNFTPYVQGQLVGWDNQIGNVPIGRAWGAIGARANILAWRTFTGPQFESELLNVHGLAHKVNLQADYRDAFSNVSLARIGVQDDLDDNSYEYTRRYFALANYVGGLLPRQYDPRLLTLRRGISPITGTTDIQDSIETVRLNLNQRLQTKRGPEGKRRIIDYMILDLTTTYFPNARRDNFGKAFGQTMYNYEWYIGDRTSFISSGWFEFFDISGQPILISNPTHTNDPFKFAVISSGFNISRPPRGSVYLGYTIINTGPISTSALNASYTYWLSPKWYMFFATSYDFGNAILLGSTVSVTKIGKDYLTSVGLTVDPQRMNYNFAFEIAPRFSPNVRFGSTLGSRFDSRFAPSE